MYSVPIKIQEYVMARNATGEASPSFVDYANVLAERTHNSGSENRVARQLVQVDEVVFSIRWLPGIKSTTMRVHDLETNEFYDLVEIVPEGRAFNLHLRCKLSVPDNR